MRNVNEVMDGEDLTPDMDELLVVGGCPPEEVMDGEDLTPDMDELLVVGGCPPEEVTEIIEEVKLDGKIWSLYT